MGEIFLDSEILSKSLKFCPKSITYENGKNNIICEKCGKLINKQTSAILFKNIRCDLHTYFVQKNKTIKGHKDNKSPMFS